jgi:hypothetical protein
VSRRLLQLRDARKSPLDFGAYGVPLFRSRRVRAGELTLRDETDFSIAAPHADPLAGRDPERRRRPRRISGNACCRLELFGECDKKRTNSQELAAAALYLGVAKLQRVVNDVSGDFRRFAGLRLRRPRLG